MKAVIVEIRDGFASVLSDDGCISKIKNNDYEIGQVIQMSNPKLHIVRKAAIFAASIAAVFVLGIGTWAYASPYSYVSLDVNPSVEFTVNRFDRVLSVKAVNDDGEEILQEVDLDNLENKTIEDAIRRTVERISLLGYFDGTIEGGIVIATAGKDPDKAKQLAEELEQSVENEISELDETVEVEAISVGLERVEEARELGVTPGKLNLVEKLIASSADPESIDLNEWLGKPVKVIMKATKDNRMATAVTGSAIVVDEAVDEDKDQAREEKAEEKAAREAAKAAEKAARDAAKAVKEAYKKASSQPKDDSLADSIEDANRAAGKAEAAANEAKTAADKAAKAAAKEDQKSGKAAAKAAQEAKKAAEKASKEAIKASEEVREDLKPEAQDSDKDQTGSRQPGNKEDKVNGSSKMEVGQPGSQNNDQEDSNIKADGNSDNPKQTGSQAEDNNGKSGKDQKPDKKK